MDLLDSPIKIKQEPRGWRPSRLDARTPVANAEEPKHDVIIAHLALKTIRIEHTLSAIDRALFDISILFSIRFGWFDSIRFSTTTSPLWIASSHPETDCKTPSGKIALLLPVSS